MFTYYFQSIQLYLTVNITPTNDEALGMCGVYSSQSTSYYQQVKFNFGWTLLINKKGGDWTVLTPKSGYILWVDYYTLSSCYYLLRCTCIAQHSINQYSSSILFRLSTQQIEWVLLIIFSILYFRYKQSSIIYHAYCIEAA